MQKSTLLSNPDDYEAPSLEQRLWKQIEKLPITQPEKELLFYRLYIAASEEITRREEEWKQIYFANY